MPFLYHSTVLTENLICFAVCFLDNFGSKFSSLIVNIMFVYKLEVLNLSQSFVSQNLTKL